jgi:pSer/pThr/pTyr-binding forkhead associated (FHA) protein
MTAYPLVRRPVSTFPFVSIGRVDGNDVALVDECVSKFHAYVKEQPDGVFLQDARSRNGCTVDGHPVAVRGQGPPTKLKSGARVAFGAVATTFYDADGVIALARRLFR